MWYAYGMYVPLVCVYVCEDTDIQTYFPWSILLNLYFIPTMGQMRTLVPEASTVYPKKYAHGFVVLCFVVVM